MTECIKCKRQLPDEYNSKFLGFNLPDDMCPTCVEKWRGVPFVGEGAKQVRDDYEDYVNGLR